MAPTANELLMEIDQTLTRSAQEIYRIADQLKFEPLGEFTLSGEMTFACSIQLRQGVYMFEIKNGHNTSTMESWLIDFEQKWNVDVAPVFTKPNTSNRSSKPR